MKDPQSCQTIEEVRSEIDQIDRKIMVLLAQRQDLVHEIVRFKKDTESIVAQGRQTQLYQQRRIWAEELNLSPEMIEEVYKTMVSHNIQKELELHKQIKNS